MHWQTKFTLFILAMFGIVVFAISYYFFHDWRVGHWIGVLYMYTVIFVISVGSEFCGFSLKLNIRGY